MEVREGLQINEELIEAYIGARRSDGLKPNSLSTYRAKLYQLQNLLPEDKTIYRGAIKELGIQMHEEGYSAQAVNVFLATADSFVVWCGRPELQAAYRLKVEDSVQPEITRSEYLRLLSAAKRNGKERDYLIIKTIVLTGINIQELLLLTEDQVRTGWIESDSVDSIRIPEILRNELISYADRNVTDGGPIFRKMREGSALTRGGINHAVKSLAHSAKVDETKCNPRCLRKLYQDTQLHYHEMMQTLVDQAQERQLEKEQRISGWNAH